MKTIIKIVSLCLLASVAFATPRFIFTFCKTNAPASVQSNLISDVEAAVGASGITLSDRPIVTAISDTNDVRWSIGIDRTKPNSPNSPLTITDEEIWTWTNSFVDVILGDSSDAITNQYQVGP